MKTDYWGEKHFRLETMVSAASGPLPPIPQPDARLAGKGVLQGWKVFLHAEGLAGRRLEPTPSCLSAKLYVRLNYAHSLDSKP